MNSARVFYFVCAGRQVPIFSYILSCFLFSPIFSYVLGFYVVQGNV